MLQIKVKKNWKVLQKSPKISDYHVLGVRSVYILLSNGAFLDFLLIYALLSRNFYVEIYALFPQIFCDWKADSANFCAFRMYDHAPPYIPWSYTYSIPLSSIQMMMAVRWFIAHITMAGCRQALIVKFIDGRRTVSGIKVSGICDGQFCGLGIQCSVSWNGYWLRRHGNILYLYLFCSYLVADMEL